MKTQLRDLIPALPVIVILTSLFAFANNPETLQEQQILNQNSRRPGNNNQRGEQIPNFNINLRPANTNQTGRGVMYSDRRLRVALRSRFRENAAEVLAPSKTVLSCEAVALLDKFTIDASNHAFSQNMIWEKTRVDTVSMAQTKFNEFLEKLRENGERLSGGRVLITGETFNTTKLRICPLIPIC